MRRGKLDIFWRKWEALPELRNLPEAQRRGLWDDAYGHAKWHKFTLIVWPLILVVFVLCFVLGDWFFTSRFNPGVPRIVPPMILGALGGFGFAATMWVVQRRVIQRYLWRRLPHLCDHCGYDLTGNESGVCPECGHSLLREDPDHQRQHAGAD